MTSPQRQRRQAGQRGQGHPCTRARQLLLPSALLLGLVMTPAPARATLWRPVLELARPQLERRLTQTCVEAVAAGQPALASQLEGACRQLAAPVSRCLVEETDASGRQLAVMRELLQQRLGPEGERIVKRCLARLVGLPAGSLDGLSLQELGERFGARLR